MADAREQSILNALRDPSSAFYKGMTKMLDDASARESLAKEHSVYTTIPFSLAEKDIVALEGQFGVVLKAKGTVARARLTPRVAAMTYVLDAALMEHAGGSGRSVLAVDGDLMSMVAFGIENRMVERTYATARLAYGYTVEMEHMLRFSTQTGTAMVDATGVLLREVKEGGGEHFWPGLRADGPRVDSIVINHFRTSVGPQQVAYLAGLRGAVAFGAFPFQLDMLHAKSGALACFPGSFYVDDVGDTITLVPEDDATMSITHVYSSLVAFVRNNRVVVDGVEYLCEKYMSVRGIMYYTMSKVECDFEAPQTLRTWLYDDRTAGVTVIRYPRVRLSEEGVPVGFEQASVKILDSRLQKVLSRVMTSSSPIVKPSEVYVALMDYNNLVVNTLDSAVVAERADEQEEQEMALAIALHVNWRRHEMRGTFNTLSNALKLRYGVKDAMLPRMILLAMGAWWRRVDVCDDGLEGEIPVPKVVDWCGNDFSVVIEKADPWVVIEQEAGLGNEDGGYRQVSYFPRVPLARSSAYDRILSRLGIRKSVQERSTEGIVEETVVRDRLPGLMKKRALVEPEVAASIVTTVATVIPQPKTGLSELKAKLLGKLILEQGAGRDVEPIREVVIPDGQFGKGIPIVPVPRVDPISAIRSDLANIYGKLPDRDVVASGYRIAEVEEDRITRGMLSINDSKRIIPKEKWVRRPKVDAGVEGIRVASTASLLGAVFKRNVGIPNSRGVVDLDLTPDMIVDRVINVCFKENWQEIVEHHLNNGLWEPNESDLMTFLAGVDESKAKRMLDEFFLEGMVSLDNWMLMAKGKVKPAREADSEQKVDHPQTIMFLESNCTNAMYSSMLKRFKRCFDECLQDYIKLNFQGSPEEAEDWYNSLEDRRRAYGRTYSYSADEKAYDRSQEHVGLRYELAFYRRMGLSEERLRIWEQTHGPKRAMSMAFGVVLTMVWGGVSGLWKTLFRNGLINLAAFVIAPRLERQDIVMLDITGDDADAEFARPVQVEDTVDRMSLIFNLTSKFFTNKVRYYCKRFRIRIEGRWVFVADPWAMVQSLCAPVWLGRQDRDMYERWVSFRDATRHYDNELVVSAVADACRELYGLQEAPYGIARAISMVREDSNVYFSMFHPPEKVS